MRAPSIVRIAPRPALRFGAYEMDAFVVELSDGVLGFRFELGSGVAIYWALPAAHGDRLRLTLVDGAAFHVDEPELHADPFVFDVPRTEWSGDLGQLSDGSEVVRVAIEASSTPPAYHCEIELIAPSGTRRTQYFAWRGAPPA